VLDAILAPTCVISQDGTIDVVNAAWTSFIADNGGTVAACGEGANYLAVCDETRSGSPDRVTASEVGQGIRGVLAGRVSHYEHDYPCHSPHQERWFTTQVTLPGPSSVSSASAREEADSSSRKGDSPTMRVEVLRRADQARYAVKRAR
jgi:hypothetical protein